MPPARPTRAEATPSNQLNRPRVTRHRAVRRQQRDAFCGGLRNQHAVKRVFVQGGQVWQMNGMGAGNGQFLITIVQQGAAKDACIDFEIIPPQPGFDGDFPEAGGAEQEFVLRFIEDSQGFAGQPLWRIGGP